jgi:hypothetical protein
MGKRQFQSRNLESRKQELAKTNHCYVESGSRITIRIKRAEEIGKPEGTMPDTSCWMLDQGNQKAAKSRAERPALPRDAGTKMGRGAGA